MAPMLKLTPLYFIKYALTAHHFRSDMLLFARKNILIKKNPLSIIFKASTGGVWDLDKKLDLVLKKKIIIFLKTRLFHVLYTIWKEIRCRIKVPKQVFFIFLTTDDLLLLTSDDLRWPLVTFEVKINDLPLKLELLWGYMPKITLIGTLDKIWGEKILKIAIFRSKMGWKVGRGGLENDPKQFFSIRIQFSTQKEASVKWAKNPKI